MEWRSTCGLIKEDLGGLHDVLVWHENIMSFDLPEFSHLLDSMAFKPEDFDRHQFMILHQLGLKNFRKGSVSNFLQKSVSLHIMPNILNLVKLI